MQDVQKIHPYNYCYTDLWDHSYSVEFTWDGIVTRSNDLDFDDIYFEFYPGIQIDDMVCNSDLSYIESIMSLHSVIITKDNFFYHGIAKYNMYTAGWDDNDSIYVIIHDDGKTEMTPNKWVYLNLIQYQNSP